MKLTTKLVLALIGFMLVAVVALAVYARVNIGNIIDGSGDDGAPPVELTGNRVERGFDVGDFSRIEVTGGWQISLHQADGHSVSVVADEALMDRLTVETDGDTLRFSSDGWRWSEDARLSATVTMPALSAVVIDGGAEVDMSGFSGDELSITVSGAADIAGRSARFESLDLEVDGAANVDFGDSRVTNADVRMDGAANLDITMAGGELTGRIGGVGSVTYGGSVSRETVRIEGLGSVERR